MYNHNKAQQSKNCVHISCDILYHWISPKQLVKRTFDDILIIMNKLLNT